MSKPQKLADFSELAQVAKQLKQQAQAQEVARQLAAEAQRQLDLERNIFRDSVGQVEPVKVAARIAPQSPATPRSPIPFSTQQHEQAVMQEALSDNFDADHFFEMDDALAFRRPNLGDDVLRKLRKGAWIVQAEIDLHGMRREEAREALAVFLRQTTRRGLRCIRVVHGKGLGSPGKVPVLKGKVRSWLVQKEEVLAFVEAREIDGGAGALIVLLQSS